MKFFQYSYLILFAVLIVGCGNDELIEENPNLKTDTAQGRNLNGNENVLLRLNLAAGTQYSIVSDVNSNMEGAGITANSVITMDFNIDVKSVENDTTKMEAVYNRIQMSMKSPMSDMTYDSEKPDETTGPVASIMKDKFGGIVGNVLSFNSNKRAQIVEALDFTEMLGEDDSGKEQKDQMNQTFHQLFIEYPEEEVTVGSTWTVSNEEYGASKTTYTVTEIEDDVVVLSIAGEMGGDSGMGGDMEGTSTGSLTVDRSTGFPTGLDVQQDALVTQMGVEMKVIIKMNLKISQKTDAE
jgi:hypothetical protein